MNDNTSTLNINVMEKSDEGHYKCLVKNPVEINGKITCVAELTVGEFSSYVYSPFCFDKMTFRTPCITNVLSHNNRSQLDENRWYHFHTHTADTAVASSCE